MPYNSETSQYERRATTVIDATPDGDTVAVAIDVKLDQGIDDYVTDLNHHNVNGNHFPATSVGSDSRFLKQSPAGVVSWADGVVAADAALKDFSNVASGAISNDKLAPISPSKIAQDALNRFTTDAEKAQWRGYNYIINGNFDIWQRGTSQTTSGYGSDDRWANNAYLSTKTHSRQSFAVGESFLDGTPTPKYFSRTVVINNEAADAYVVKRQSIEGVSTLAGKKAVFSFYARADGNKGMSVEFVQSFGTGGTPSSSIIGISVAKINLTTIWTRFAIIIDIPSISGKSLGSAGNDYLYFNLWFDAGSNFNSRTDSLGHQSGTFDIACVSLVEGDVDVKPIPRSYGEELALCQRYYATGKAYTRSHAADVDYPFSTPIYFPCTMRAAPVTTLADGGGRANVKSAVLASAQWPDSTRHEIWSAGVGDCRALGDIWTADAEL